MGGDEGGRAEAQPSSQSPPPLVFERYASRLSLRDVPMVPMTRILECLRPCELRSLDEALNAEGRLVEIGRKLLLALLEQKKSFRWSRHVNQTEQGHLVSPRRALCQAYYEPHNCIYAYGGTSLSKRTMVNGQISHATLNDMWKFDVVSTLQMWSYSEIPELVFMKPADVVATNSSTSLLQMSWERVVVKSAPYPVAKADASMVVYKSVLVMVGGNVAPPSPIIMTEDRQCLTCDINVFNPDTCLWRTLLPRNESPDFQRVSSTIEGQHLIVYGSVRSLNAGDDNWEGMGLRGSLWVFDLESPEWIQPTLIPDEMTLSSASDLPEDHPPIPNLFPRFEQGEASLIHLKPGKVLLIGEMTGVSVVVLEELGTARAVIITISSRPSDANLRWIWRYRVIEVSGRWSLPPRNPEEPGTSRPPNVAFPQIAAIQTKKGIRLVSLGLPDARNRQQSVKMLAYQLARQFDEVQKTINGFIKRTKDRVAGELERRREKECRRCGGAKLADGQVVDACQWTTPPVHRGSLRRRVSNDNSNGSNNSENDLQMSWSGMTCDIANCYPSTSGFCACPRDVVDMVKLEGTRSSRSSTSSGRLRGVSRSPDGESSLELTRDSECFALRNGTKQDSPRRSPLDVMRVQVRLCSTEEVADTEEEDSGEETACPLMSRMVQRMRRVTSGRLSRARLSSGSGEEDLESPARFGFKPPIDEVDMFELRFGLRNSIARLYRAFDWATVEQLQMLPKMVERNSSLKRLCVYSLDINCDDSHLDSVSSIQWQCHDLTYPAPPLTYGFGLVTAGNQVVMHGGEVFHDSGPAWETRAPIKSVGMGYTYVLTPSFAPGPVFRKPSNLRQSPLPPQEPPL